MNDLRVLNKSTYVCNSRDYFFRCKNDENDEIAWFKNNLLDF